jgi:thioredoxin reductase (NADPH)
MPGANAEDFQIIVVGGGLAGLTAGLFAARYGHPTLVLEATVPGGHLVNLATVEDFPGFPDGVPGYDLGPMAQEQAERHGARFESAEVSGLEPADAPSGPGWRVVTASGSYRAPAVIVASGSRLKPIGVPGEDRLFGRGVSHCATCDGPLVAGKVVGVVAAGGGDDAALNEALTLSGYASRVVVLHAEGTFDGQETFRRRLAEQSNVEVRHHVAVTEVLGDGTLAGVRLKDDATGEESDLDLAALFVYAGLVPNTAFLESLREGLRLDPEGRVPTDSLMRTALPGLFAAGDVRQDAPGFAVTAAGEGAAAAVAAHRYLTSLAGAGAA